eukprot:m.8923 g.8923  ORF g.8923 m.8923 type:complete len:347 (-) comp5409_c0_seq2:265-1305(-)
MAHLIVISNATTLILVMVAVAVQADLELDGATCKGKTTMYSDENGIRGCYQLFDNELTWTQAKAYCADSFDGSLAPARTEGEQRFLLDLAKGTRFWIGANSRNQNGIWVWDEFGSVVDFKASWVKVQSKDWTQRSGQVLVNGYSETTHWVYESPNTNLYAFVCRKDACLPDRDVLDGVCSLNAPSVQKNYGWVAGVVIAVIAILLLVIGVLLKKYKQSRYSQLVECMTCRKIARGDRRKLQSLETENERLRARLASVSSASGQTQVPAGIPESQQGSPKSQAQSRHDPLASIALPRIIPQPARAPASLPELRSPPQGPTRRPGPLVPLGSRNKIVPLDTSPSSSNA